MPPYNVGIIGYGGFGRFLHQAWSKLPEVRIIAASKRRPTPENMPGLRIYSDWHDLIADPEVQIVAIATPPHLHAQMACAAMKAGKHVLIEKPLAISTIEAEQVLEVQKRTGMVATVNHLLRFNPIIEAIESLTNDGVLGQLRRANVENYAGDEGLEDSHWFWNKTLSGGILVEHAVHFIDLINHLTTQSPKHIESAGHQRYNGLEDQVMLSIIYNDGLMATHYHHFARPPYFESTSIRLEYDLAQIDLHGWVPLSGAIIALVNGNSCKALNRLPNLQVSQKNPIAQRGELITGSFGIDKGKDEVYQDCTRHLLLDLVKQIKNPGHRPRVSLNDGLRSLQMAKGIMP